MTWDDLKDEPTSDLIEFIRSKDDPAYKMLADLSFIALTFRFEPKVVHWCRKLGRRYNHSIETCDSIAYEAFKRFNRYPFGFNITECEKRNLDIDKCFTVFIFRIAQRCLFDYYNKRSGEDAGYDGSEIVRVEFPPLDDMEVDKVALEAAVERREKIEKVLKTLGDNHLTIYLTYLAYEKVGFKLPRKLLAKLRDQTGLKQNSIRVYKMEAFDAVKKLNESNGKTKNK